MWKLNSKKRIGSLKQVLNMFRFSEAFYLTCECVTLYVECGQPMLVLRCNSISFSATICKRLLTEMKCLSTGRVAKLTHMS